jgi:hypothetical protein
LKSGDGVSIRGDVKTNTSASAGSRVRVRLGFQPM